MSSINNNNKVWLVTGTSSGLGLSLVLELLNNGYKVAALTRSKKELLDKIPKDKIDNALVLETDVTSEASIAASVQLTIDRFSRIDVLVNNAAYGFLGSVEESSDSEFRKTFDVNVFAVLSLIRAVVPHMRSQRSGLIINTGSYVSYIGVSNYSSYSATKHALSGITQSLALELEPFGIKAVHLSLGGFRTNFISSGLKVADNKIAEYNTQSVLEYFERANRENLAKGDPLKAAKAIISISQKDLKSLPINIPLGSDSYAIQKSNLEKLLKELEEVKDIAFSTDF